ncbi:unnamed protein product [Echinostoma caproni]|uniref:Endo/exonuclease/phosphatase domain-containing protein n=1 Tax=Echinostoma caproni TaxID=27848 RepID=A0A182ZZA2_9TREM|nr:unnamed protein product [Echinostoma caproni]
MLGVYRSPSSRPEDDRALLNRIAAVSRGNHSPIIVGDFNLPGIEWEYEDEGDGQAEREFMDCFHAASLYQHVKEPTRIRLGQRPSTLDLVFTWQESEISDLRQEVPLGKGDHNVLLPETCIAKEKPPCRWCRNFGQMIIEDLRRDARTRAWFPQGTEAFVDQRWEKIRDQLIELTERHAPLQPRGDAHKPQWWKPAIKRAIGERAHRPPIGSPVRPKTGPASPPDYYFAFHQAGRCLLLLGLNDANLSALVYHTVTVSTSAFTQLFSIAWDGSSDVRPEELLRFLTPYLRVPGNQAP